MVKIKPFDLTNVETHYRWNNDETLNYYDSDYPHRYESFESFLKRVKAVVSESNEAEDLLEIHLEENDKLIGIVDLHAIDQYNRRCFVECTIGDRQFMHRGMEVDALRKTLNYCFEQLNMHKVATTSFDFNTDWIEEVEQIGFCKEGELRDHALKQGRNCNKLLFSILQPEYRSFYGSPADISVAG